MKNDDEIERLRAERDAARAEVEKVEAERILCSLAGFRVYRRDVACTGPAMKMNDNTEDQPTIDELLRAAQQVVRAINDPGVNPAYHYQQVNNLSINWPTMYRAINNLRTVLSRGLS